MANYLAAHNGVLTAGGVAMSFTQVGLDDTNRLIETTNANSGGAFDSIEGIHEASCTFDVFMDSDAIISNSGTANLRSGKTVTATWLIYTGKTYSFSGRIEKVSYQAGVGGATTANVSAKGKITGYAS